MDNLLFSDGDFDYLVTLPIYESQLIAMISETFSSRGVLAAYIRSPKERYESMTRDALDSRMGRELSVICVHRPSGELCGGFTSTAIDSDVFEHHNEPTSPRSRLLAEIDCEFFNRHSEFSPRQCLHQHALAVSSKWAGNKIGENLTLASLKAGKAKGLTFALVELTASVSQHICIDLLKYTVDQEISYSEYVIDGIRPFPHLDGKCVLAFKEIY